MRDRSSRLARALVVAGASVFIVVGAVFGANALTTPGRTADPAVTSGTPATTSPAESAEPAETTESGEAPDTTATDGAESDGQAPGDTDGSGSETDSD